LLVLRLVKFVVGKDSTEVVHSTGIIVRRAHRNGHILRVEHVLGYGGVLASV